MTTATITKIGREAALAKLLGFDFKIAIDASGSMNDPVKAGSPQTRWEYVQETAIGFATDIAKIDDDGIGTIVFWGNKVVTEDNCSADAVRKIFATHEPRLGTPTAEALTAALALGAPATKKQIIAVFTDGLPSDEKAVIDVIVKQAAKQETEDEVKFVFIQIGDDKHASAYLKNLDDGLTAAGAKYDIVATYTIDEVGQFDSTAELLAHALDN